ncbi:MAG TPA: 2-oxo acid dehydrogenase subunit E2 [Woeseiaceae bacterium]|nr:2-oxo acid dehydrogenase subunit E2 [Woeseiaceae bacterium]
MAKLIDIKIPDLGDFENIEVVEILVKKGDSVNKEEGLITLETDKASMDVPSPESGTIDSIRIKVGDQVKQGHIIGKIVVQKSKKIVEKEVNTPKKTEKKATPVSNNTSISSLERESESNQLYSSQSTSSQLSPINEEAFSLAHASPSVRKFARELGVNLIEVKGTGSKSRILHDDIKVYVKAILSGSLASKSALPKIKTVDYAKFGEISVEELGKIQRISGPRLQASWVNLPHVTQHDLADITEMESERLRQISLKKNKNIKISPLAFIIKACALTLEDFPKINASLSEDASSLVYKKYLNIGFAADTKNGLVVPVIKGVNHKTMIEIAKELIDLSECARNGNLSGEDMQGATFTISSLGGIGGTAFTPIINAPEVAILGVSRSSMQPVWFNKEFKPRLMLPLSFSYDHRVIDGAYAARFTTALGEQLTQVKALVGKR